MTVQREGEGIEWTRVSDGKGGRKRGETWNPIRGCTHAGSPACDACYAEAMAARFDKPGLWAHRLTVLKSNGTRRWSGVVESHPPKLADPLRWREPRGVFVNSTSDVFHEKLVDTEDGRRYIAALFGVMAACPQHTFMVLTKRPEKAVEWFAWLDEQCERDCVDQVEWCILAACDVLRDADDHETADLLADRHGWAQDGDYYGGFEAMEHDEVPGIERRKRRAQRDTAGWDGETWPLPNLWFGTTAENQPCADRRCEALSDLKAAGHIATAFVSYEPACGPVDFSPWLRSGCASCEHALTRFNGGHGATTCGLLGDLVVATGKPPDNRPTGCPSLDQIIAGGESGRSARPSHPDWFRSVRDQCVASGTAYFHKQNGEWAEVTDDTWTHMVSKTGKAYARGDEMPIGELAAMAFMRNVGKKVAGRMLDARTWDEFPEDHGRT